MDMHIRFIILVGALLVMHLLFTAIKACRNVPCKNPLSILFIVERVIFVIFYNFFVVICFDLQCSSSECL